jgi:excisionase family DNA binding protein
VCTTDGAATSPLLLSVKQTASLLSVTTWASYRLAVDEKRIPYGRIGRRIVIHREDVAAFARAVVA